MSEQNKDEDRKPLIDENEIVTVERATLTDKNTKEDEKNTKENEEDEDEEEEDVQEENESVKNLIQKYPELVLEENTQKYVITVNGVPQCYTQTLENARNCMWNLARLEKNNHTEYQCFIQEMDNPNDIHLIGYNRFYIISYSRTLINLSVRSVLEIVEKPDTSFFMEEKSKPTMIGRLLGYN